MKLLTYTSFLDDIKKRIAYETKIKSPADNEEGAVIPSNSLSTDYNMTDIDGKTLINYAIQEGNLEAVKDLVENKHVALLRSELSPLAQDHLPFGSKSDKYIPYEVITSAIKLNQPEIAAYLLEHVIKKYGYSYLSNLDYSDINNKQLELFKKSLNSLNEYYKDFNGDIQDISEVGKFEAFINMTIALGDSDALFNTILKVPKCYYYVPQFVSLSSSLNQGNILSAILIKYFSDISINQNKVNKYITPALEMSLNNKNVDTKLITTLLEYRADINYKGHHNVTPLMQAAKIGRLDLIKMMIEKGADVNAVDINGNNFLHFLTKSTIEKFADLNLIEANKLNELKNNDNYFGDKPGDTQQAVPIDQGLLVNKLYYYHIKTNRSLDGFDRVGVCNGLSFLFQLDESPNKSAFYQKLKDISSWDGNTQFSEIILLNEGEVPKIQTESEKDALYLKNNNGSLSVCWYENNRIREKKLDDKNNKEIINLFGNKSVIKTDDEAFIRAMDLTGNIPKIPEWENFYSQVIFHQYVRGVGPIIAEGDQRNRIQQLKLVGDESNQIKNVMRYNNNKCTYNQLVELCKVLFQLPNQAMVDLGGSRHAVAIVKDNSGKFLFYDPNVPKIFPPIDTPEKLAEIIYNEKLARFNRSLGLVGTDGTFELDFNIHCMEKNYQAFLNDSKQFKQTNNSDIETFRFYLLTERYSDAISLLDKNKELLNEKDTLGIEGARYCLNSNNETLIKAALKEKEITDTLSIELKNAIFVNRNNAVLQALSTEQLRSLLSRSQFLGIFPDYTFGHDESKAGYIEQIIENINYLLENGKSGFMGLIDSESTKNLILSAIKDSQEPEEVKQALMTKLITGIDKDQDKIQPSEMKNEQGVLEQVSTPVQSSQVVDACTRDLSKQYKSRLEEIKVVERNLSENETMKPR